jgi:hypothetical protein
MAFPERAGATGERRMNPMRQREAFARLKRAVFEDYSYRDLRGVDWKERFRRFGPRLRASGTARRFAFEAAGLLSAAKDIHLWLRVKGEIVPTFRRCVQRNVAAHLLPALVPEWREHGAAGPGADGLARPPALVMSGRFADGIAYLCIRGWPAGAARRLRPAYRVLSQAAALGRGIIIDVRANGGGSEPLAARFAGCFVEQPVCYAKHLRRSGGRLTGPFERWVKPNRRGPRHRGRVAVLVGPGTVSSCESFVLMMRQVPGCKLIGQPTAGASGNPKPVGLGNGVVVFVPSWQDLDLDGRRLEGRGIAPDIEVRPRFPRNAARRGASVEGRCLVASTPDTRHSSSDPVLAAALKFLRRQSPRSDSRRGHLCCT